MTTTTIFAGVADGQLESANATYATALAGSGTFTLDTTATARGLGQTTGFSIFQLFFSFDTSPVGSEVVSAVVFSLNGVTDLSTTDFVMTALGYDWSSGGLTTADWRNQSQLSALTSLATFNSSGYVAAYMDFISAGAAFNSYINGAGTTYFMVASSRNISGTQPSGNEAVIVTMADQSGTTTDPKLVITSAAIASLLMPRLAPMQHMLVR